MRLPTFPVTALALSMAFPVCAPAQGSSARPLDPQAQDSTTTDAQSPSPPITPEQIALIDRYLTPVRAQVSGKVDTRSATVGQGITLEVTDDATLANGTELPHGSKLIGRILRAQAWQKDGAAALLSIKIDRAVLKSGGTVPIRCIIRTIAVVGGPSVSMPDVSRPSNRASKAGGLSPVSGPWGGPVGPSGPMSSSPIGADSSDPAGYPIDPSSDGSIRGSPGVNTTRPGGNAAGGIGNPSDPIAGDPGVGGSAPTIGDRTRDALGNTTTVASTDPERPVVSAGVDIHDAPHRTGLPGVMLSGASVAGASGTLSTLEHDITLDSATHLVLGVITR